MHLEWSTVAEKNACLSDVFVRSYFSAYLPLTICFDRSSNENYTIKESAIVKLGEKVKISLCRELESNYYMRVLAIVRLIEVYFQRFYMQESTKSLYFALGDSGRENNSICFASNLPNARLIPDSDFILRQGYGENSASWENAKAIKLRKNKAYWRGTDTGVTLYENRLSSPRIIACQIANKFPELLDARITGIEPRPDHDETRKAYLEMGILAPPDPNSEILNYRYQLDIDGHVSAWSGLFLKLLSGSPVLKIKSGFGYYQWYYHRLSPWDNYVPVASDLSDLCEKIDILKNDQTLSELIGRNGRRLALSLDYDTEMINAADALRRWSQE